MAFIISLVLTSAMGMQNFLSVFYVLGLEDACK